MKWRSIRLLVSLFLVFIVLIVGISLAFIYLHTVAHTNTTSGSVPPLPTPGSARTTYTNARYGYTLDYPTQWYLKPLGDKSLIRVFMKYDPSVPQAVAFEIRCDANASQLDARTYWKQKQPQQNSATGEGLTTFSSGVSAYIAKGHGQTPFTLYTLVHSQVACTILIPETDPFNAHVVLTTINSFRWQ